MEPVTNQNQHHLGYLSFDPQHLEKSLNRNFFSSKSKVTLNSTEKNTISITVHCELDLVSSFFALSKKQWPMVNNEGISNPLKGYFLKIAEPIDIDEFTIYFTDCTISIQRLYARSIINELGYILSNIYAHLPYFSLNLNSEGENEIHIPALTEKKLGKYNPSLSEGVGLKWEDYTKYWVLYTENETEGLIYDLAFRRVFAECNLTMV